jgi:hypothetical protein
MMDGKAVPDERWAGFAIAHDLRVGYFITFEKIALVIF